MNLQLLSIQLLIICCVLAQKTKPTRKPKSKTKSRQEEDTTICGPKGTCIQEPVFGAIDPRVMNPDESGKCAPGKDQCQFYTNATQCGYIHNSPLSTRNGRASYGSHPWLAYIVNQTGFTGSGVLLDRYHVLTAAHKVYLNKNSLQRIDIYLGVQDSNTLETSYKRSVEQMIIHPNFNPVTLHNDLAVLRLKAHVPLGYHKNIGTACLPKPSDTFIGKRCTVAGWGATKFAVRDTPTQYLKQVTVPIVTYDQCWKSMRNLLGENTDIYLDKNGEICAGGESGKDACTDDGGAPLICKNGKGNNIIAGIVIWGKKCGEPNVYGVYADIPKYVNWINRAIQNLRA